MCNNILATPAGNIRKHGTCATFKALPVGTKFELNGNVWIKKSSRTATGYWPAILPEWSYMKGNDIVNYERLTNA